MSGGNVGSVAAPTKERGTSAIMGNLNDLGVRLKGMVERVWKMETDLLGTPEPVDQVAETEPPTLGVVPATLRLVVRCTSLAITIEAALDHLESM